MRLLCDLAATGTLATATERPRSLRSRYHNLAVVAGLLDASSRWQRRGGDVRNREGGRPCWLWLLALG
eukprot:5561158-Alexandrium_andersonii.AAC.1